MFDFYWKWLGYPWSVLRGLVSDAIPFALVDIALVIAISCLILLVVLIIRMLINRHFRPSLKLILILTIIGPIQLLAMSLGQGAMRISLAPTALRPGLFQIFQGQALSESRFEKQLDHSVQALHNQFELSGYQSLEEKEILALCNQQMDTVLNRLGLPPGRTLRRVKTAGPVTTFFGLVYGGPAFHEPIYTEAGIISQQKYPAPKWWRFKAICHETAHAKGFMREMDAEILTQLTLLTAGDPRLRMLGHLMFIKKSGKPAPVPTELRQESIDAYYKRLDVLESMPAVQFADQLATTIGLKNTAGKYGTRKKGETWNPNHRFFSTIPEMLRRMGENASTQPILIDYETRK